MALDEEAMEAYALVGMALSVLTTFLLARKIYCMESVMDQVGDTILKHAESGVHVGQSATLGAAVELAPQTALTTGERPTPEADAGRRSAAEHHLPPTPAARTSRASEGGNNMLSSRHQTPGASPAMASLQVPTPGSRRGRIGQQQHAAGGVHSVSMQSNNMWREMRRAKLLRIVADQEHAERMSRSVISSTARDDGDMIRGSGISDFDAESEASGRPTTNPHKHVMWKKLRSLVSLPTSMKSAPGAV